MSKETFECFLLASNMIQGQWITYLTQQLCLRLICSKVCRFLSQLENTLECYKFDDSMAVKIEYYRSDIEETYYKKRFLNTISLLSMALSQHALFKFSNSTWNSD